MKKLVGQWSYHSDHYTFTFYSNGEVKWTSVQYAGDYHTGNYRVLSKKEMLQPNNVPEILFTNRVCHITGGRALNLFDAVFKYSCWSDRLYDNLNIAAFDYEMEDESKAILMGDIYKKKK